MSELTHYEKVSTMDPAATNTASGYHTASMGDYDETDGKITPVDNGNASKDVRVEVVNGSANANNSEKDKAEKDNEKTEPAKAVSLAKLFSYADGWDKLWMFLGTICAMGHGAALPAMMIVFGDMTDLFINSATQFGDFNLTTLGLTPADLTDSAKLNEVAEKFNISLTNDLLTQMKGFALYYFIIGIVVLFVAYGQVAFWLLSSHRQAYRIRIDLFRAILRQNIGWFDTHEIGELNTRLSDDVNKIQEGTGDKVANFIQWFTTFVVGIVIGFAYGWKMTLVILAFTPVLAISAGFMTKFTTSFTSQELAAYAKAGAVAEEVFGAIRTVVAFGGEKKECERYHGNLKDARVMGLKKALISGIGMGSVFLIIFCVYAVAFWYGSKLVREDPNYTAGNMLIVFFAVLIGAFSLGNAAPSLGNLASARGAAYAIFELIDTVPPIDSAAEGGLKPDRMEGNIEFRDVAFRYPSRPDYLVLDGLDLKITVGQTVALVGASGCGKSTTVQLLQRFYDPERGAVFIDGNNIRELNVTWLRKHIGLVSQEPVLFGTTIAENIRYGREDVTHDEIVEACKEANAHSFIQTLPRGYNTLVGERGAQLSGGQKQRIAIARALVSDPKILLLDEATSALDTESEATVQAALDKARMGRTTLVIAHRLSTIKNADVIIGVMDGKVAEMGTHDELMAHEGIYNTLVTNQTSKTDENEDEVESLTKQGSKRHLKSQVSIKSKVAIVKEEEEEKLPEPNMGRLFRLNAPEAGYIIIGCFAAILNGAVQPAFALVFSEILGVYALPLDQQEEKALLYSMLFVAIGVGSGIAMVVQFYFFALSGEGLTMRLRSLAFKAMISQDMEFFDNHKNSVGALTARLATDASAVQGATGSRLGTMFQSLASIGTAIIIGFIFSWAMTLGILAFVPFIMVGGIIQMQVLQGDTTSGKAALETASKISTEAIENMRTVASLTREERILKKFEKELIGPHKKTLRAAHLTGFAFSFTTALIFFAYAASFTLGAHLVEKGDLKFEDMFKVFFAIVMSAMGAGQASAFAPDYGKGKAAAAYMFSLFDRKITIDSFSEEGDKIPAFQGSLEFSQVKFNYPTRPTVPVLTDLCITAEPGQTVALVGSSGCGKSTTVQLTERFYDVASGEVAMDGKSLPSLNVGWVRSQIGIVSQEPVLFDCSVRENIEYGDNSRQVPMDEVIAAARAANIHNFIESLPDGYETNCGDKGTQLSGGQKQRVAIARALVRNPKILLLDEATSALDTESEKIVQEALDKARAGRTSLVIAHRLSTIQNADKIVVIRHGTATEQGTHSELLAQKGFYHRLHNAQLRHT